MSTILTPPSDMELNTSFTTMMGDFEDVENASMSPYDRGLSVDHAPSSAVAIIEGITMVLIFVGALFANLMAMTTILTDKVLRKNFHNLLILNLIIVDLGVTITSMSFSIWSIYDDGYLLLHSDILCSINGFGAVLFTFANFTTILAISLDRYLTIVWSTRFPPTKCRAIGFIIFCWFLPILNVLPPAFEFLSDFNYHPDTHHCSPKWEDCLYFIIWFTFIFGVTVPIMAFSYIAVIWTIRRQELQLRSHAAFKKGKNSNSKQTSDGGVINVSMDIVSNDQPEGSSADWPKSSDDIGTTDYDVTEDEGASGGVGIKDHVIAKPQRKKKKRQQLLSKLDKLSADKRVALTGILLVMTTIVCWTPYFIIHSCFIPINPSHWLGVVSMWLGYSNSLLDPLVYSFMNRRVRARYRALIGYRIDWKSLRSRLASIFRRGGAQ
ncbi:5-hydroxytryptamine receptor 7-like [Strongylocentrotus purpuratus]|uniref:G-protein coupled receptors family 1 profile domain-containing protein n=1 Tax=Strongylocentrotus purpuratus TaxID=7668 RepID=A0A7M7NRW4_STRPU|nr:5-hydroxytryptamine receptor 7-like [Strongylocentrotus purpuratus]|eukprot:XP_003725471.1 PREDICTED: 5-hydroxytryptamine receptor 7 [Strongylocentrotus purpuratus]